MVRATANVNILKEFRKGEFVIDDLEQGKTWAKNINACGEYFQYYKKATFIKAMLSAMKDKTFSFKIFFKGCLTIHLSLKIKVVEMTLL